MDRYNFPTIENSRLDRFTWKEGDQVLIRWPNRNPEQATIAKLYVSRQSGYDVVYGVTVTTKACQKPFGINHCLIESCDKLTVKENIKESLFA